MMCVSLQWRHSERDSVSLHQPYDCLLNLLFRRRSNKTSTLRVTGVCAGNSPVTAENFSIWWRHHVFLNVDHWVWCMFILSLMGNYALSVQPGIISQYCVLFLAATKQLYEWYFLSVCPSVRLSVRLSVCPSVRLSHLFDYVPIIVSSWNFQELSHWTRVRSMQKVKVRGQRSRSQRSRPKFSFPDCNSSLNSHMMMKWYI